MGVRAALRNLGNGLLDLVYPPACLICGRGGPAICAACAASFSPIPAPLCAICGRPDDPPGAPCRLCAAAHSVWGGWAFATARAAAIYEGPLRHAVHLLKYRDAIGLAEPLGALLANRCLAEGLLAAAGVTAVDAVVPVPVTRARERRRGYNQAALLAEPLAAMLGAPLQARAAVRRRAGRAQMTLSLDERRRNVSGQCFAVVAPEAVAGKRLLVVDDVFTTGATVQALSEALRAAGAIRVDVVTLTAGG